MYRARFSEITPHAISRACANLVEPDKRMSDAVNVRRELDLRIGKSELSVLINFLIYMIVLLAASFSMHLCSATT